MDDKVHNTSNQSNWLQQLLGEQDFQDILATPPFVSSEEDNSTAVEPESTINQTREAKSSTMTDQETSEPSSADSPQETPSPQTTQTIYDEVSKYERIVNINPENDRAWDTLGKLYKSLGRYDDAYFCFDKAIELAPNREVYHYHLGLVYTVQNRYLEAVEAFKKTIDLNNDYILAHGALAGCYRRLGRDEEADTHIDIALPNIQGESEYNQACFNAICGNLDQAIDLLKSAWQKKDTSLAWMESDPDLTNLRDDPRYHLLLEAVKQEAAFV
jgi:tetratricopeptide (TPR) repeat protein